jgi:hypothetical protein
MKVAWTSSKTCWPSSFGKNVRYSLVLHDGVSSDRAAPLLLSLVPTEFYTDWSTASTDRAGLSRPLEMVARMVLTSTDCLKWVVLTGTGIDDL